MQLFRPNQVFMLNGKMANSPSLVQNQCNSAFSVLEQVSNDICELMQVELSENNAYFSKSPFSLHFSKLVHLKNGLFM
jgi:hypothetical protein